MSNANWLHRTPERLLTLGVVLLVVSAALAVVPGQPAEASHVITIDGLSGDWAGIDPYVDLCKRIDGTPAVNDDDTLKQGAETKFGTLSGPYPGDLLVNSSVPQKADLCKVWSFLEFEDGSYLLHFAWERSDSGGEVSVYLPLHGGDGTWVDGDWLIKYDYTSSEDDIVVTVFVRSGSSWVVQAPPAGSFDAAVSADNLFAETRLDLTALGILTPDGSCETFFGTGVFTETGQASQDDDKGANPTLKDYVRIREAYSTCGSLKVVKEAVGGDGTFGFSLEHPEGVELPDTFDLTTTDGTASIGWIDLEPGWYGVAESSMPDDWEFVGADCGVGNPPEEFEITTGEAVVCTFTNEYVPPTTTTTTTTTVPATTTTTVPTTTTTVPTTTTTVPTTTTTTIPTEVLAIEILPKTGFETLRALTLATGLILTGAAMVLLSTRRREQV